MNSFGVNLTGLKAIYSKATFFKPNATRPTRTFECEGGPGCSPDGGSTLGALFGPRTLTGRWTADGQRDTIDAGQLEAYIDEAGNEIDAPTEKVKIDAYVVESPGENVPYVPCEKAVPDSTTRKPKNSTTEKANKRTKAEVNTTATVAPGDKVWNPDRIIELFKGGMKIPDIAVEMGYVRGQGQNRTRGVLKKAGLV